MTDMSGPLTAGAKAELEARYRSAVEVIGGFAYSFRIRGDGAVDFEWSTDFPALAEAAEPGHPGLPGFLGRAHPDDASSLEEHLRKLASGENDDRDLRFRAGDSSYVWLRIRARPYTEPGEDGSALVFGIAEDETDRTNARLTLENSASERERELSSLLEISYNLASTLELEPLLGIILTELKTLVDYTGASILKPDGEDLIMLDYRGPMPRDQVMGLRIPAPRSRGYQKLLTDRVPVITSDVLEETAGTTTFQRSVQQFRPFFGYAYSVLLTPLIVKDKLIGVLRLDHRERGHFTERHATLSLAIANQAAVAMETAQLYERTLRLAKLEERQRIARDLHDSVSQSLYGIKLGAQTALELQRKDPAKTADSLKYVRDLADAGLKEMRALLFELRPEAIATEGLISGLNKLTSSIKARYGISVRQELCAEPEVRLDCKEALYRIAQEALHNVVKHAHAANVCLRLDVAEASISLEILDDGRGFSPSEIPPGRMGLVSMAERAFKLGGVLDMETAPGEGTEVHAILPIN